MGFWGPYQMTLVVVLVVGMACECDAQDEAPPPTAALIDDVRQLQAVVGSDPAVMPLAEVDRAVLAARPVRGARLIEMGALPAARQQVERFRELELNSEPGRALRELAATRYDARVAALEQYREVLERGLVEDLDLASALRAQRLAAEAILELQLELEGLRPLSVAPRPRSARPAPPQPR